MTMAPKNKIDFQKISARVGNILRNSNIYYMEDLINIPEHKLSKIKGCGRKSILEINDFLKKQAPNEFAKRPLLKASRDYELEKIKALNLVKTQLTSLKEVVLPKLEKRIEHLLSKLDMEK